MVHLNGKGLMHIEASILFQVSISFRNWEALSVYGMREILSALSSSRQAIELQSMDLGT